MLLHNLLDINKVLLEWAKFNDKQIVEVNLTISKLLIRATIIHWKKYGSMQTPIGRWLHLYLPNGVIIEHILLDAPVSKII